MFRRILNTPLEFKITVCKFDQLNLLVQLNLCVLVITKTEFDNNFSRVQFIINEFKKSYRLDISENKGKVLI